MSMMVDQKNHEQLLEEWKNRLGLQAWRIKLKDNMVPEDMIADDSTGCVDFVESVRSARIEIMDKKYYGDRIVPYDWEKTLVHELMHLKLSLLDNSGSDLQDRLLHQYIDDIARALVDAKRCGGKEE